MSNWQRGKFQSATFEENVTPHPVRYPFQAIIVGHCHNGRENILKKQIHFKKHDTRKNGMHSGYQKITSWIFNFRIPFPYMSLKGSPFPKRPTRFERLFTFNPFNPVSQLLMTALKMITSGTNFSCEAMHPRYQPLGGLSKVLNAKHSIDLVYIYAKLDCVGR